MSNLELSKINESLRSAISAAIPASDITADLLITSIDVTEVEERSHELEVKDVLVGCTDGSRFFEVNFNLLFGGMNHVATFSHHAPSTGADGVYHHVPGGLLGTEADEWRESEGCTSKEIKTIIAVLAAATPDLCPPDSALFND